MKYIFPDFDKEIQRIAGKKFGLLGLTAFYGRDVMDGACLDDLKTWNPTSKHIY
jgi:hypothetical protein